MGLFNFGKREPDFVAVFNKYYKAFSSLLISAKLPLDDTILKFELLPFMHTVGVWSVRAANLDYVKFKQTTSSLTNDIIKSIYSSDTFKHQSEYIDRCSLYFDVATGEPYRGEWLMSTAFPLELRCHMVTRCMVAFGDILLNSHCANDYFYSGYYASDFTAALKVYSLMMEKFYKLVLEYCSALTNGSKYVPMIKPEELQSKTN